MGQQRHTGPNRAPKGTSFETRLTPEGGKQHHPKEKTQHHTTPKEDGTAAPPTKGEGGTQHHPKGGEKKKQHRLQRRRRRGRKQHPSNLLWAPLPPCGLAFPPPSLWVQLSSSSSWAGVVFPLPLRWCFPPSPLPGGATFPVVLALCPLSLCGWCCFGWCYFLPPDFVCFFEKNCSHLEKQPQNASQNEFNIDPIRGGQPLFFKREVPFGSCLVLGWRCFPTPIRLVGWWWFSPSPSCFFTKVFFFFEDDSNLN